MVGFVHMIRYVGAAILLCASLIASLDVRAQEKPATAAYNASIKEIESDIDSRKYAKALASLKALKNSAKDEEIEYESCPPSNEIPGLIDTVQCAMQPQKPKSVWHVWDKAKKDVLAGLRIEGGGQLKDYIACDAQNLLAVEIYCPWDGMAGDGTLSWLIEALGRRGMDKMLANPSWVAPKSVDKRFIERQALVLTGLQIPDPIGVQKGLPAVLILGKTKDKKIYISGIAGFD
jgi:hypothetical protein